LKRLRSELFYRTHTVVEKGDEFYHVLLKYGLNQKLGSFLVETFHGHAGSPPKKPENTQSFRTMELAANTFENITREIEGKGFRSYSLPIHGEKSF
jgi:hypothetical protein